jgi:hypothetical protein
MALLHFAVCQVQLSLAGLVRCDLSRTGTPETMFG